MSRIPHACRRKGRYVFRRRARFKRSYLQPDSDRFADDRVGYRHLTSPDRFAPGLLEYAKGASPDDWIGQKLASIGASSDSRDISAARAHFFGTRAAAGSLVQRLF